MGYAYKSGTMVKRARKRAVLRSAVDAIVLDYLKRPGIRLTREDLTEAEHKLGLDRVGLGAPFSRPRARALRIVWRMYELRLVQRRDFPLSAFDTLRRLQPTLFAARRSFRVRRLRPVTATWSRYSKVR